MALRGTVRHQSSRGFAGLAGAAAEGSADAAKAVPEGGDERCAEGGDGDSGGDGVMRGDPGEADRYYILGAAEGDVRDGFGAGRDQDARGGL